MRVRRASAPARESWVTVVAVEDDAPAVRLEHAGELGDEGGLAGAVGADHRMDLAPGSTSEIEVVRGDHAAEALVEPLDPEDGFSHRAGFGRGSAPTAPCLANRTRMTSSGPKMKCQFSPVPVATASIRSGTHSSNRR